MPLGIKGGSMENRWVLTDEVREKYKPIVAEFMNKIWSATAEDVESWDNDEATLKLSDTELRPYTLLTLMQEEFGYSREDFDDNGWELDYWITLEKSGESCPSQAEIMCIHGCGMTFELNLSIKEWM